MAHQAGGHPFPTTHVGSLPRPEGALRVIYGGDPASSEASTALDQAVRDAVKMQVEAGIDSISDGEMSKMSYAHYVSDRLTGLGPGGSGLTFWDLQTCGLELRFLPPSSVPLAIPDPLACTGPIRYTGREAARRDIERFKSALAGYPDKGGFMTAASPGVVALFFVNHHYPTHRDYVDALAEALREEYELIAASGLTLQLDCPDLAAGWHVTTGERWTSREFLERVAANIAAINTATASIPPERMRLHTCWGNYEGPHDLDLPLNDLVDELAKARPATISVEGANPRHAHEIDAWHALAVNGKNVAVGFIDTASTYVEHPNLVRRRIEAVAEAVGPERLIASTDCGFGTWAGALPALHPVIAQKKLTVLAAGAELARSGSTRLAGVR